MSDIPLRKDNSRRLVDWDERETLRSTTTVLRKMDKDAVLEGIRAYIELIEKKDRG